MNIQEYISSGIIESYVLGLASDAERQEFEQNCLLYPELAEARNAFELSLEKYARENASTPPLSLKTKIQQVINREEARPVITRAKVIPTQTWWKYAAAAAVLILIGSMIWNIALVNTNQQLKSQIATLDSHYNRAVAKLGDLEKDMEVIQQNPNVKMAAMKGMPETPTAAATVYWDSISKNVYLLINNLPSPPSDKQYQLWALINGQPVDVGMIENDYLVSQKKLLLRFENVQGAQAFAVTLEAKGGSPTPKGKMYVLGNL